MSVPAAYLSVIIIWSTTPLAIQWSSEGWGFLFGVSGRMVLGLVLCLLLLYVMGARVHWHRKAVQTYVAAGIGIYGAMMMVYWGAQFIPSGLIAVIFGLNPIVTGFVAALWLKERSLTPAKLLGAVLGVFGLSVIFQADAQAHALAWQGIAALVLSVVLHAISAVWVKRISADMNGLDVTTGALLCVAPLYAITWWLFGEGGIEQASMQNISATVYLGIFGSVIGFSLYYYVLKHVQANKVALITLVTPVLALLIGQNVNGEQISSVVWLGSLCIIGALAIHQWGDGFLRSIKYAVRRSKV
jgi:drug/metabolite transporter (DMT)-like permease